MEKLKTPGVSGRCVLLACFLVCLPAAVAATAADRPSVLIILVDQLPASLCGCVSGRSPSLTPSIDQLAVAGMSFDNYVVTCPERSVVDASLWTGRYPVNHGVVARHVAVCPEIESLPGLLTEKGFRCVYIGRPEPGTVVTRKTAGNISRNDKSLLTRSGGFEVLQPDLQNSDDDSRASSFDTKYRRRNSALTRLAGAYLQQVASSQSPFLMVVAYDGLDGAVGDQAMSLGQTERARHDSETDEDVSSSSVSRFGNAQNLSAELSDHVAQVSGDQLHKKWRRFVAELDHETDRLLRHLDRSGVADDTVVIFSAFRGVCFGQDAADMCPVPFADAAIQVPLLVRWPGRIPQGRRSAACFSSVDLLPTVCGLLGVGYSDEVDGVDMSDSLRVDCSCEPQFAFLQSVAPDCGTVPGCEWRAVRDHRFTFGRTRDGREFLLRAGAAGQQRADATTDPRFRKDLMRMRQWLAEKQLAVNDEFQSAEWYMKHWIRNGTAVRSANGAIGCTD